MYCIKCGVELGDSEKQCPLCKTVVCHPDFQNEGAERLFPENKYPKKEKKTKWLQAVVTVLYVLAAVIVLMCDLQFGEDGVPCEMNWSGYVIGALLVAYVGSVLPTWLKRPNSVIFVPCTFVAAGMYLSYINFVTSGDWFLSFAFPVVGVMGLIATTMVALLKYVRRGVLFIYGGVTIALGGFMLLMEFLMSMTFASVEFAGWSLYPLVTLVLFGGVLIFLGICRPARETMERKFFI